jgi:hypothetical protein
VSSDASLRSDSPSTSPDSPEGPFGLPRWAIWGGGALLLFLVAFGIGYVAGAGPIEDLRVRLGQTETQAEESEARVERLEAELSAQQALSLLYRTMLDVDARNFGVANERLDAVAATLARTDPEVLGVDVDAFNDLRDDVASLDVRVAEDLAGQRAALSDLARRLAELIGG